MNKSIHFSTLRRLGILFILFAFALGLSFPAGLSAAEGKKGLNAVNVKTLGIKQAGDPIPDIDITIDQAPGGREMVMPGDNVRVGGNAKALDAFVNSTAKALKKGDRIALVGFGSFSAAKHSGDDLESPWHNQDRGDTTDGGIDEFYGWFETCTREHDKRTVAACIQEALVAAGVIPMFQDQSERGSDKGEGTFTLIRSIGNTGGGTFTLIRRAGQAPEIDIGIEIPESKGTVKFFNESKSFGGGVVDIVIRVNGSDI